MATGHAGGGAKKRGGRGNVERAQAVAAGADNVEDFAGAGFGIERRWNGFVAQRAGESGDFAGGFAFFRQRGQKIGLDHGRNFFVGELFHGLADLLVVERSRGGELLGELFEHARILSVGATRLKLKVRADESMDRRKIA